MSGSKKAKKKMKQVELSRATLKFSFTYLNNHSEIFLLGRGGGWDKSKSCFRPIVSPFPAIVNNFDCFHFEIIFFSRSKVGQAVSETKVKQ